jgi:hypothetical protein
MVKSIVHDWLDDDAMTILRACRRAMRPGTTLLLLEQLIGQGPDPAHTAFSDLNMLVSPGGLERSLDQYRDLLERAGFSFTSITETGTPTFAIEATAADDPVEYADTSGSGC